MLKPYGTEEQEFKRVSTTFFLLQSSWRGNTSVLKPFQFIQSKKKGYQGMKKAKKEL